MIASVEFLCGVASMSRSSSWRWSWRIKKSCHRPRFCRLNLEPPENRIHPSLGLTSVLVNSQGEDTTDHDTQSETSTIVFGTSVLVGFNDWGSQSVGGQLIAWSKSTDGGNTFSDMGTLPNGYLDGTDPVLARDNTSGQANSGRVYFVTLGTGPNISVFRSDNGGQSFLAGVNGMPGFGGGDFVDKPWIAVDNSAGTGQEDVYLAARNFAGGGVGSLPSGVYVNRSIDGGATWGQNGGVRLSNTGQGAFVAVGPDHSVYVFWLDSTSGFLPWRIMMSRSVDLGVTFSTPAPILTLNGTGTTNADLQFTTNSYPHVAVNPVTGQLYLVVNDKPAVGTDRANIYFSHSENNGGTWSTPQLVNDDSGTNDQFLPTTAVTPDGTHLFIGFYDRRNDPANRDINTFGVVGTISGSVVT
jgi:hypothetical protein